MRPDEITVLVVDDMAIMRTLIKNAISVMGFKKVLEAQDGETAWKIINQRAKGEGKINFIISDWNMPNMTGYDLLKLVRSDEICKDTPFLMVTAEGEKGNISKALKAGVDNFVVKPFTPLIILEKIEKILA